MNKIIPLIAVQALIILTGCFGPAGDILAGQVGKSITKAQEEPKKALWITGIPAEFEGVVLQVFAFEPADTLGKTTCWGGVYMDSTYVVRGGKAKSLILEGATGLSMAKSAIGIAKSCDSKERVVSLNFLSDTQSEKKEEDGDFNLRMFIYTKGANVCDAAVAAELKSMPTYSFSKMESTINFSDFIDAENCEAIAEQMKTMRENLKQNKESKQAK